MSDVGKPGGVKQKRNRNKKKGEEEEENEKIERRNRKIMRR